MPFAIKLGDKTVRLDDLPMRTFEKIAADHEMSWVDLLYGPAVKPSAYADLIVAAAAHLSVEPPEAPVSMRDFRDLYNATIVTVEDDLPTEFGEGGVPKSDGAAAEAVPAMT